MNRRTALKNVVILSAAAGLLPSCLHKDKDTIQLKNISLSSSEEDLLEELAETIIPKTPNFIGAKDLKSHEFILTMVDDCMPPEDQRNFTVGLAKFAGACKNKMGKSFVKCSPAQRKEWLLTVEKKKDIPEDAQKFYGTAKWLTVQSFTSSKDYMTNVRKYRMAPGPIFKGCVPADPA